MEMINIEEKMMWVHQEKGMFVAEMLKKMSTAGSRSI